MSHDVDTRPLTCLTVSSQVKPLDHFACPNVPVILDVHSAHIVRLINERAPNVPVIMVRIKAHVKGTIITGSDGISQRARTCPNVPGARSRQPCPVPPLRRRGHVGTLTENDHEGRRTGMKARTEFVIRIIVRDNPEVPGGKAAFPIYKGSKKKGTQEFTGRVAITDKNRLTPLWRRSVITAARPNGTAAVRPVLDMPLIVRLHFTLSRPVSVSERKRPYPIVKPDVDNLVKPTYDALTNSGIWKDDNLIIGQVTSKAYVNGYHADGTPALDEPGCVIEIFKITPPQA